MPKSNAYRDTKLEAENLVKDTKGKKYLDWIILRYANVLGTRTWDEPFKLIVPYIRLGIPKVPTSIKKAIFPYVTIETVVEATLKSITARPNQTITILDGETTINKYLTAMEKVHNIKKSYMPIKPVQILHKYFGKYFPTISGLLAALEFSIHSPKFENVTMKRELKIKTIDFDKWVKKYLP